MAFAKAKDLCGKQAHGAVQGPRDHAGSTATQDGRVGTNLYMLFMSPVWTFGTELPDQTVFWPPRREYALRARRQGVSRNKGVHPELWIPSASKANAGQRGPTTHGNVGAPEAVIPPTATAGGATTTPVCRWRGDHVRRDRR